jgi:hypothetical protein
MDGEGFVEPAKNTQNGRATNYTMDEDILLCITWKQIAMDGVWVPTKSFTHIGQELRSTLVLIIRVDMRGQIDLFVPDGVPFHQNVKSGRLCWPVLTR